MGVSSCSFLCPGDTAVILRTPVSFLERGAHVGFPCRGCRVGPVFKEPCCPERKWFFEAAFSAPCRWAVALSGPSVDTRFTPTCPFAAVLFLCPPLLKTTSPVLVWHPTVNPTPRAPPGLSSSALLLPPHHPAPRRLLSPWGPRLAPGSGSAAPASSFHWAPAPRSSPGRGPRGRPGARKHGRLAGGRLSLPRPHAVAGLALLGLRPLDRWGRRGKCPVWLSAHHLPLEGHAAGSWASSSWPRGPGALPRSAGLRGRRCFGILDTESPPLPLQPLLRLSLFLSTCSKRVLLTRGPSSVALANHREHAGDSCGAAVVSLQPGSLFPIPFGCGVWWRGVMIWGGDYTSFWWLDQFPLDSIRNRSPFYVPGRVPGYIPHGMPPGARRWSFHRCHAVLMIHM